MLSLTIEVFVLYSVDEFGEENKGHHQKHNLHLVKWQMIVSLIILSKLILYVYVHMQTYQGNIRMRLYFKSIPPAKRTSSKDRSLSFPLELMYFILLDFQDNLLHFTQINFDPKFLVWNVFYAAWFKKHLRLFQSAWLMYMKTWFFRNMRHELLHLLYKNISRRYLQT